MRLRALLTLFLGMIIAGSAVVYTRVVMKSSVSQPMMEVVVANEDIAFGHIIKSEMLSIRSWPAEAVPKGVFSSIDEVIGDDEDDPRRAKHAMSTGDLVSSYKVSNFGERVTITQKIDPSMRAVAIRVNDVTGVAGFVAPTDRVDVTLTRNVGESLKTSTILQDVEVLGIDQAADGANSKPSVVKTVTVQVRPLDAQKLALAQQAGTLSLSLRHIDAADRPVLDTISVGDLSDEIAPRRKIQRSVAPTIVVNRGGQRTTVEVPRS